MLATSYTYTSPETLTCEVPNNDVIEISLLPVCIGDTYWVESYREVVSTRTALRARKRSGFTCKRASEIRHHRGRSTEEKRKKKNANLSYFAQCVRKLTLYSDVIHLWPLQIA